MRELSFSRSQSQANYSLVIDHIIFFSLYYLGGTEFHWWGTYISNTANKLSSLVEHDVNWLSTKFLVITSWKGQDVTSNDASPLFTSMFFSWYVEVLIMYQLPMKYSTELLTFSSTWQWCVLVQFCCFVRSIFMVR